MPFAVDKDQYEGIQGMVRWKIHKEKTAQDSKA